VDKGQRTKHFGLVCIRSLLKSFLERPMLLNLLKEQNTYIFQMNKYQQESKCFKATDLIIQKVNSCLIHILESHS